jgi:hypoxanthine phosphoribosyltransferase
MNLIQYKPFVSHSGRELSWKIDCDAFSDSDWENIACIIKSKFSFSKVIGIPRGGLPLQYHLEPFAKDGHPILIVDDVLTTGMSMEEARFRVDRQSSIGVSVFDRGRRPDWVKSIFTVNEWAQV